MSVKLPSKGGPEYVEMEEDGVLIICEADNSEAYYLSDTYQKVKA